jgi:hypothetical protein
MLLIAKFPPRSLPSYPPYASDHTCVNCLTSGSRMHFEITLGQVQRRAGTRLFCSVRCKISSLTEERKRSRRLVRLRQPLVLQCKSPVPVACCSSCCGSPMAAWIRCAQREHARCPPPCAKSMPYFSPPCSSSLNKSPRPSISWQTKPYRAAT